MHRVRSSFQYGTADHDRFPVLTCLDCLGRANCWKIWLLQISLLKQQYPAHSSVALSYAWWIPSKHNSEVIICLSQQTFTVKTKTLLESLLLALQKSALITKRNLRNAQLAQVKAVNLYKGREYRDITLKNQGTTPLLPTDRTVALHAFFLSPGPRSLTIALAASWVGMVWSL